MKKGVQFEKCIPADLSRNYNFEGFWCEAVKTLKKVEENLLQV